MDLKVVPLNADRKDDFYRIHSKENGHGWCFCIAWWAPTWDAWSKRTSEENRRMREQLFDVEQYDGYLMYDGEKPIGWCQVGPRDRLHKLAMEYELLPNSDAWAISCFVILSAYREIGLGGFMLTEILKDLKEKGVKYVQGFPRRGRDLAVDDLWTGPEKFFEKAGFTLERDHTTYPIYSIEL